jgi:hypothetical protein
MGLISSAVLYFRLAKNNKVISILTKYLLQYKRVSIPQVGSFEIKTRNAELNVADKQIAAPIFITEFSSVDAVSEHQYNFFSTSLHLDKSSIANELISFGEKLKEKLSGGPFMWKGLGTLKQRTGQIVFEAEEITLACLNPVAAEKVIRQNASHTVLVGEREHSSEEMTERLQATPSTETSYLHLTGWIVLVLAILAIIYFIYTGSFSSLSSGSNWK